MEEAFPRGGKYRPSQDTEEPQKEEHRHRKKRSLSDSGEKTKDGDFLFGSKKSTKSKKKKKAATDSSDDVATTFGASNKHSMLPLGGGGVVLKKNPNKIVVAGSNSTAAEPFIEALGFSRLAKGTKLLGVVREVQEEFALVSLPNLLTGYVLRNEAGPNAPPLSQVVSVGQVLAVVILRTITESVKNAGSKSSKSDAKGGATRRRIQVSLEPSSVNIRHEEPTPKFPIRGKIQGIEDNGILIQLGHGRKGFMPFSEMDENSYKVKEGDDDDDDDEDSEGDDEDGRIVLQVGRIGDFIVKKGAKSSTDIIPLSLPSTDRMAKHIVPTDATPSIQEISPGWLVKVKVEAVARNGLCVAFLGNVFRGAVELAHMGGFWIPTTRQVDGSTDWKGLFRDDQSETPIRSFTARILAVDAATKMIRLTVSPHLMDLRPPPTSFLPPVGTVVEDATVIRLDPGVGALLALPPKADTMDVDKDDDDDSDDDDASGDKEEDDDEGARSLLHRPLSEKGSYTQATKVRAVYVHISKAMDEQEDGRISETTFAKEFAPSSTHKLRILSTSNLVEGVASGATAESVINAHVLTHSDVTPGKVFRRVPVCAHLDGGAVLVEFGMEVRGLLTASQLFDQAGTSEFRSKMLKAKYAVGAKVDVRVLSSDPTTKRCFLTAKKALISASNGISSYTECKIGQTATGFVSKVDDRGLFITFFNKVYGRVTARSLALELGVDDHRENYKVGDVVQCRIANIKKVRRGRGRRQGLESGDEGSSDEDDSHHYFWELTLSLRLHASEDALEDQMKVDEQAAQRVQLHAGAVLPEKSMKVVSLVPGKDKSNGSFVPGYAIVSVKSKYLIDEAESAAMLPYVECKLPYDCLLDEYDRQDLKSAASLDERAEKMLKVGKSLKYKGILMTDPKKSGYEYSTGLGRLTVVSIRPRLVAIAEAQLASGNAKFDGPMLPSPQSEIFEGAEVIGYVAQIDHRHGAFVRFLDGLTGLVPKSRGGLDLEQFGTTAAHIVSIDHMRSPPKILLSAGPSVDKSSKKTGAPSGKGAEGTPFSEGDVILEAEVESVDFYNANLKVLDKKWNDYEVKARVHCAMADSEVYGSMKAATKDKYSKAVSINKFHPFHGWSVGKKLKNLKVVSAQMSRDGTCYIELTDRTDIMANDQAKVPAILSQKEQVPPGTQVAGVVKQIDQSNRGVHVVLGPKLSGFIPGVECSNDLDVLNNLSRHFPVGARLRCTVLDKMRWRKLKAQGTNSYSSKDVGLDYDPQTIFLSVLSDASDTDSSQMVKPLRSALVVGRIQRSMRQVNGPALMMELRGGYVGRCCITELEEPDEWGNMPLGHSTTIEKYNKESAIVSGDSEEDQPGRSSKESKPRHGQDPFSDGNYVKCRVLAGIPSRPAVDVSLRASRIEGDLDDDEKPEAGDMCHAFVVNTNKSGCFVRLSRSVEGRVILKELSDDFLPNPAASFPPGRLVVGKVKDIREAKGKKQKTMLDLDMRESTVLQSEKLQFSDVELNSKHKGTVTRVEAYGVFVRLENSTVSGLVHKSESSDKYVKNLLDLYDPGDLVKVLVIKKDEEEKRIGFSMKASHFVDDEDSDDESLSEDESDDNEDDADMRDVVPAGNDDLDSDDENFATKLKASMSGAKKATVDSTDDESSSSDSDSDEDEDNDSDADAKPAKKGKGSPAQVMDTDVGFDWSASAAELAKKTPAEQDSDSEDEDMEEDANPTSSSHKSRKKQAQKKREEQEISRRETALADGTADENPETAADFERLLSGSPNSSEIWIRYMAFHLSLADITSARAVAERAFTRIEFREEREKLNVWCALLALEHKYGSPSSLQATIDRACQQNNPKQVYLRASEMVEKEVNASLPDTIVLADDIYKKMCRKFKSKKKVWLANLQYLLRSSRHKDAHDLLRKSLKSLPEYKHVETMSKFAQLEFEFGSLERGRTIFDEIILQHPRRLDLVSVYADKEVKHGSVEMARSLFEKIANPRGESPKSKLSEKQMKSVFKQWYRIEEKHGTAETQQHVKDAAKSYVDRTTAN